MAMEEASGRGFRSLVKMVERRAGMSFRSAIGIRRVIPGKRTDPLGNGRMGRLCDLVWPMSSTDQKEGELLRIG